MVGIVTFDDAMDVMEEEATEDIEIMGGMSPSEKTYSRATTWDLFKQRIPWLLPADGLRHLHRHDHHWF